MYAVRRSSLSCTVLMLLILSGSACSSGTGTKSASTTTHAISPGPVGNGERNANARDRLQFRAVMAEATGLAGNPCSVIRVPRMPFADRTRKACFALGPVLLTGANIGSTKVVYDSTTQTWAVRFHWTNDDFLAKVARPLTSKEFAVVLNRVVLSAPRINPGFSGRDVEISGFSRGAAIGYASTITGAPRPAAAADAKSSH